MARPSLPECPNCGQKLPYDRNSRRNNAGEIKRFRQCVCGYSREERIITLVSERYPGQEATREVPLSVLESRADMGCSGA